ncbi:Transketolase, thiamine diphosphate binding domain-containing protein [Aspergillus lucknowensis]|uniref:Transketolase, thiamine diphosphate binding domain-containing protein n=1 Tax=Aspergillus lucknowensis TaxID=176173 RepID=A0ABR4LIE8_9EURO
MTNPTDTTSDAQAVRDLRKLIIDCCRQNGGGHGGSAIGMVPLAIVLWRYTMRYNPRNADWFNRDRFVLSNGHAAILLYTMLHAAGYPEMTMDELKLYASAKAPNSTGKWQATVCHGHPEIEVPGVEVTTGPLGQGIANAVGLAIASKHLAAQFNKPGYELITAKVYCTTGDGCLQEGVAQEAMAIAGHLGLDNLVLCYDNNQVTCDGPLDWIVSEDTNAKVRALGWDVLDVWDGDSSTDEILAALRLAQASTSGKPVFINIRTTIGYGTSTAGTFKSHHGTYSDEDAAKFATHTESHALSQQTKDYFAPLIEQGWALEQSWNDSVSRYTQKYPDEARQLQALIGGTTGNVSDILQNLQPEGMPVATRQWNGHAFNTLMSHIPQLMAGGADLWNSNQMGDQSHRIFDRNHRDGRVIRFGIREHAMAAISNGLSAFHPGAIIPVTATFFMFYLYAAPGVRMGALSHLRTIHVATHDSIGEGQNGPTHQPVEIDSLFRAMPNLLYIRPADEEEVIGAWMCALSERNARTPSIISLARDPAAVRIPSTGRKNVALGGYTVLDTPDAQVTLVSCGSELQFAYLAAMKLTENGIRTRVVSIPCLSLFEQQPEDYQGKVLSQTPHIISVEAYVSTLWARICTASISMDSFGYSGSGAANFQRFGLDSESIVRRVTAHVGKKTVRRWVRIE